MSKTILAQVDGFTPLIDSLVSNPDIGIIGAAVFGRMWRYCQMENGICHASLESIADEIGVSRRTAIRYSDILVSLGYLKDLTPKLRNRPHTYSDTGKAMISIKVGVTESHTSGARSDTESQYCDTESHPGVTESHLKIEDKKRSKKQENNSCPAEWMARLYSLSQIDPATATLEARANLSTCGKALIAAHATFEQVELFERNWYALDWRGQKGQAPTVKQIRDEWGKYSRPQNGNGSSSQMSHNPMIAAIQRAQQDPHYYDESSSD